MHVNLSVGARFNLVKTCSITGKTVESGWFENLVLDVGLNRIGVGTWFSSCSVGTSSATPQVTDIALGTFVAQTTTKNGSDVAGTAATSPFYSFRRATFRFPAGTFSGQNLAEVAIGWGGSNIFNRALIRDNLGDPTTITVLSTEVLDVVTEVRIYQLETDTTGTITLKQPDGTPISDHTYTARRSALMQQPEVSIGERATLFSSWSLHTGGLGTILQKPSGSTFTTSDSSGNSISNVAYSNNSYEFLFNCNLGLNNGNAGTNRSLFLNTAIGTWQIEYTPPLPKNDTQSLTIPLKVSWGRYTP